MIRNIKKLELVDTRFLSKARPMPGLREVYLPYFVPAEEVPIVGLASLNVSDEVSDGLRTYTSKVTATMEKRLPHSSLTMAVRLTDVQGRRYLMGGAARPYPLFQQEDKYADRPGEPSACQLTITLQGPFPAMEIFKG